MKKYRLGNDVFDISPEEETEFLKQNPDAILVSGPNETDRSQNNQLTTEDLDWINNTDGNLKDIDPKKFQEIKNKLLGGSNAESNLFGPLGASPTGNFFDKKTNKQYTTDNNGNVISSKPVTPEDIQKFIEEVNQLETEEKRNEGTWEPYGKDNSGVDLVINTETQEVKDTNGNFRPDLAPLTKNDYKPQETEYGSMYPEGVGPDEYKYTVNSDNGDIEKEV